MPYVICPCCKKTFCVAVGEKENCTCALLPKIEDDPVAVELEKKAGAKFIKEVVDKNDKRRKRDSES